MKHGKSTTAEYSSWKAMNGRCRNPNDQAYDRYGGRGITICERWRVFENFLEDMGIKPSEAHSLDRKDNSKGYCKSNCKWSTPREQTRNRRDNRLITFNGQTLILSEWSRLLGIDWSTLDNRLKKGWPIVDALTKPVRPKQQPTHHI